MDALRQQLGDRSRLEDDQGAFGCFIISPRKFMAVL